MPRCETCEWDHEPWQAHRFTKRVEVLKETARPEPKAKACKECAVLRERVAELERELEGLRKPGGKVDRTAYHREYMREYQRKRRARERGEGG